MSRTAVLVSLVLSLIGLFAGYVLTNNYDFGLCYSDLVTNTFDTPCHQFYERIGDSSFYGMGALAFIFLLLLIVPRAFSVWWKFAIWFIPLAVLIFVTVPESHGWVSPIPAPEQVFQWVSALYVLISLIIIIGYSGFKK